MYSALFVKDRKILMPNGDLITIVASQGIWYVTIRTGETFTKKRELLAGAKKVYAKALAGGGKELTAM